MASDPKDWFVTEGAWWGASFVFHALGTITLREAYGLSKDEKKEKKGTS